MKIGKQIPQAEMDGKYGPLDDALAKVTSGNALPVTCSSKREAHAVSMRAYVKKHGGKFSTTIRGNVAWFLRK